MGESHYFELPFLIKTPQKTMFNFVQTNGSSDFLKFMSNKDLGVFYDLVYNQFRRNMLFTCFHIKNMI